MNRVASIAVVVWIGLTVAVLVLTQKAADQDIARAYWCGASMQVNGSCSALKALADKFR